MTSYQKLKIENERLRKELYTVCCKGETEEAAIIKTAYMTKDLLCKAIFQPEAPIPTERGHFVMSGVFKKSEE